MPDELVDRIGAEMTLGDPADGLDVAQPAGTGLDVRLEVVGRVVVTMMPRGLLGDLCLEELARAPHVVLPERAAHRLEQVVGSGEQPRLDQRRRDADVGGALALAVVDRAHAVPDLEADVPEEGEEALDAVVPARDAALRQQDHDVDVRAGMQLAAAVATDGDERHFALAGARVHDPRPAQHEIDHPRAVAHQCLDRFVLGETTPQAVVAVGERAAECRNRIRPGLESRRQRFQEGPGW